MDKIRPEYFDAATDWAGRRRAILPDADDRFVGANITKLEEILTDDEAGAVPVINIGAWSLRRVMTSGRYLNIYERANLVGHAASAPDTKRIEVDTLLDLVPPDEFYFAAVALESNGVRFYGEYCMAFAIPSNPRLRIFDRDSYELVFPPLGSFTLPERQTLSKLLRGEWGTDLVPMVALKCRALLEDEVRLVTEGRLAERLLVGEEFVEVHWQHPIASTDVEEVRVDAVDVASIEDILGGYVRGATPRAEELAWIHRRVLAERSLEANAVPRRVAHATATR